ncbi:MAG: polysaccharide biosynthesis protein [Victivallales bacterium]|nr:polysaccharide biosynthesis protein [Victivallales bacterium]
MRKIIKNLYKSLHKWQITALCLVLYDYLSMFVAYFLALWTRFDCQYTQIPPDTFQAYWHFTAYFACVAIIIYGLCRLYKSLWKYASYHELALCTFATAVTLILHISGITTFYKRMPVSYFLIGGVFQFAFLLFSRFLYRFLRLELAKFRKIMSKPIPENRVMLIGAGAAAQMLIRDLNTSPSSELKICCAIDDDSNKWHRNMEGVPIAGGRDDIMAAVKKYNIHKILFAIPSASAEDKRALLNICKESGCELLSVPGLVQLASGEVSIRTIQEVKIEDLLGRAPIKVNMDEIFNQLAGKVILVTGGGGSIGSELCRQIAAHNPKQLIIFDIYENNAYDIQQELLAKYHENLNLTVLIGSVRDSRRILEVFHDYRPEIVFHAAAHKHVPLMEDSPCESIKNNVIGTYKTAYAAMMYGTKRFLLISTDKAVNPTNIMGASKRLCEMVIQTMNKVSQEGSFSSLPLLHDHSLVVPETQPPCKTEFVAVRFGNVLGSNGSVIPLFKKQIAAGGPVCVTDPNIIRYFMTIPEAVSLVLQAETYAKGGEIFVLDMGNPIKIDDLARNLIKLSGFKPDVDIKIKYTGLRPGEKLYEEKLMSEEGLQKTQNNLIHIAKPIEMDTEIFLKKLEQLHEACQTNFKDIRNIVADLVPTYHPIAIKSAPILPLDKDEFERLAAIAKQFEIHGDIVSITRLNKGYINQTFRIETKQNHTHFYTLQRINTHVFPDIKALMENFVFVTEHLHDRFQLPGKSPKGSIQLARATKDGKPYLFTDEGAWRLLTHFDEVFSLDLPNSPETFYQAGLAFGSFIKNMADVPAEKIHEIIPNFHNTYSRYLALEEAIKANPKDRVKDVQPEIDFIRSHISLFSKISVPLEKHEIPLRVCHNDCNLNNILFDNKTSTPVAIIDLDTVMPSTPLYDFGDSMRIGTNTAKDDEKDLSKVSCDLTLYEQYARGWLEACGDMLTPKELELLPYASLVITSEDGIRFLADHINGDIYYSQIDYPGQNLDRSRTQLALVRDMEAKLPQIKAILSKIYSKLNLPVTSL